MKRCNNCRVLLQEEQESCPLCCQNSFEEVAGVDFGAPSVYPAYNYKKLMRRTQTLPKLLLFISIAVCALTLFINVTTWERYDKLWSLFVIVPVAYLWLLIGNTILSKMRGGGKIILQTIGLSCVVVLMDLNTGFQRWSVNIVIPMLVVTAIVLVMVIVFSRRLLWNDYIGYAITLMPLGFIPILLYVFGVSTSFWASASCALCALLSIIAMGIIAPKRFRTEVARRFHF